MKIWILLLFNSYALAFLTRGYDQLPIAKIVIEANVNSPLLWSMKSIFGSDLSNKISAYYINGDSPCFAQSPYLTLKNFLVYEEQSEIYDFAIVDSTIYYLTDTKIFSLNLLDHAYKRFNKGTELISFNPGSFTYLYAFKLPNSDVAIFVKGSEPDFFYIIHSKEGEMRTIRLALGLFSGFTGDMRVIMHENYIFIPAGTSGVIMYRYIEDTKRFIHMMAFNDLKDARDVAVKSLVDKKKLLLIVADYEKGLVTFTIDLKNYNFSKTNVIEEFVKAKSISMIPENKNDRLLIIMDALGGASRYVVLSLNTNTMEMNYDQIRLLDGVVHYGDITNEYASIIMDNSVMVLNILHQEDTMVGYINSQGVNNAKLLELDYGGIYLIYSRSNEIFMADVIANSGYLICRPEIKTKLYNFTILGQAKNCKTEDGKALLNCYYTASIKLTIVDKDSLKSLIFIGVIIGVAVIIFTLFIMAIITSYYRKYKKMKGEIDRYEKLRLPQDLNVTPSITMN